MRACEQGTTRNRSLSTGRSSCSPSGAPRGRPGSHDGGANSYPAQPTNLPTFSYEARLEIQNRQASGIAVHTPALVSSQSAKGIALGWGDEDKAVMVRKIEESQRSPTGKD